MVENRVYYLVPVKRVTVSVAHVVVSAASPEAARQQAKAKRKDGLYETRKQRFAVGKPEVQIEPELETTAIESYRKYLRRAAGDEDFNLATVVTFEAWKREYSLQTLVKLARTYGAVPKNLARIVGQLKSSEVADVNQSLESQLQYLLETCGYAQAHQMLVKTLKFETQQWDTEPVDDTQEDEDS